MNCESNPNLLNQTESNNTPVRKRSKRRVAKSLNKHQGEENEKAICVTPTKALLNDTSFSSPSSLSMSNLKITSPQNSCQQCDTEQEEYEMHVSSLSDQSFLISDYNSSIISNRFNIPLIMMEDDETSPLENSFPLSQHTNLTQDFGNMVSLIPKSIFDDIDPTEAIDKDKHEEDSPVSPIIYFGNERDEKEIFEEYFQNLTEIESRSRSNSCTNKPSKKRKTHTLVRLKGLPISIKHVILSFLPYLPLKFHLGLALESGTNRDLFVQRLIQNSFGRYSDNDLRTCVFIPFLNVELLFTKEPITNSEMETNINVTLDIARDLTRKEIEKVCILYAPIFNHVRNLKITTCPTITDNHDDPTEQHQARSTTNHYIQHFMDVLHDYKNRYSLYKSCLEFSSSPYVKKFTNPNNMHERRVPIFSRLESIYLNVMASESLLETDNEASSEPFIFSSNPSFDKIITHISFNKNFVPINKVITNLDRFPKLRHIHTCLYFPDSFQNNMFNLTTLQNIQSLKFCNISSNLLETLMSCSNRIRHLDLRGLNYSPFQAMMKKQNITSTLHQLSLQFTENDIITDSEFSLFLKSNCITSLKSLEISEPESRSRSRQECTLDGFCYNTSITKLSLAFFLHLGARAADNLARSCVTSLTVANSFKNATHFSAFMEILTYNPVIKRLHISTNFSSHIAFENFLKFNTSCEKFIGEYDDKSKLLVLDIKCLEELKTNISLKVLKLLNFTFDVADDEIEKVLNQGIPQIDVTICRKAYVSSFSQQ